MDWCVECSRILPDVQGLVRTGDLLPPEVQTRPLSSLRCWDSFDYIIIYISKVMIIQLLRVIFLCRFQKSNKWCYQMQRMVLSDLLLGHSMIIYRYFCVYCFSVACYQLKYEVLCWFKFQQELHRILVFTYLTL